MPALLPQFMTAWSLTSAQGGWLVGIMFAGYMVAVVPLVSFTDVVSARTVWLVSSLLSALSCFGLALTNDLAYALGFRALAGFALAGMYMPGLRASPGHGGHGSLPSIPVPLLSEPRSPSC